VEVTTSTRVSTAAVRPTALLVGAGLAALAGVVIPYADNVLGGSQPGYGHLPIAPVFLLLLLVGAWNGLPARRWPRLRLTKVELALIYCMVLATCALASCGYIGWVLTVVTAPAYFDSPEHRWRELFFRYLPSWFAPKGTAREPVIRYFYESLPRGAQLPWAHWVAPLTAWTIFVLLFFTGFLCLAVLLRRRWLYSERLTFPLAQVPIAIIGEGGQRARGESLFGTRLFWIGFAIPVAIHSLNGVHLYFPALAELPTRRLPLGDAFAGAGPLGELSDINLWILFAIVGVAYLLPREISLSMWLFFWVQSLEKVALDAAGMVRFQDITIPEVLRDQDLGMWAIWLVLVFWGARKEFAATVRHAARRGWWRRDDPLLALPYLLAAVGFVLSLAGMTLWLAVAGMFAPLALAFLVAYLGETIVLSRLVNAAGVVFPDARPSAGEVVRLLVGTRNVSPASLTVMAYPETIFTGERQTTLFPYLMEVMKVSDQMRVPGRWLLPGLFVALFATLGGGYWSRLHLAYHLGANNLSAWRNHDGNLLPFVWLKTYLTEPQGPAGVWHWLFMAVGGAGMSALVMLQRRFLWWPIHPVGALMADSWMMDKMWFSFLLGWLCAALIARYGGYQTYRRFRLLFLGLVIGEVCAGVLWIGVDAFTRRTGYAVYPGV